MKPFYTAVILLLSWVNVVHAQDLIVTTKGDSVNCVIAKISKKHIYFVYKNGEKVTKTLIPVDQVTYHRKKYFDHSDLPAQIVRSFSDYPKFRVALLGGWSYRIGKLPDDIPADLKSYAKGLKSGFHLGSEAGYYFAPSLGVGLKYSYFHAGNEIANVTVTDRFGATKTGAMKDDINVHYIGPAFYLRYLPANNKLLFQLSFSLGYMRYIDNAILVDKFSITGGTMGATMDFAMDYMITKHFGVGASFAFVAGDLTKYKLDDGTSTQEIKLEKGQTEDLSRLDLSAGVRWNF